ncbi:MAG: universal stress protein [Ruminiclostridium sp.]|nr:universal stress protein [Ruminiclostridium sp.]MBQ9933948.1 universal stress protein [Ruminiclostridium sp.]
MEIKKVLLPIDGSERSKRTVRMVKRVCRPEECEIYIVKVIGAQLYINSMEEIKLRAEQAAPELEEVANMLEGFTVHTQVLLGSAPGVEIVEYAKEIGAAVIFLTRSTRGPIRKMGSVATYLVKNATFLDVFVMREDPEPVEE